jgi:hypothetical protein
VVDRRSAKIEGPGDSSCSFIFAPSIRMGLVTGDAIVGFKAGEAGDFPGRPAASLTRQGSDRRFDG